MRTFILVSVIAILLPLLLPLLGLQLLGIGATELKSLIHHNVTNKLLEWRNVE